MKQGIIKLRRETRRLLLIYKAENDLRSYEEVIRDLLARAEANNATRLKSTSN